MLTIRSFRNEDPPRLLGLWKKTQRTREKLSYLDPLSMSTLQSQVLGLPLLDIRSIMLAFDNGMPVGYIHTAFPPDEERYSFNYSIGHICFLCIDPEYHDVSGAGSALIQTGEEYLSSKGAQKIYGGSPSPSAPFYTGFYSGSETVGFLQSDTNVIAAFQSANYHVHQKTSWFHFDVRTSMSKIIENHVTSDSDWEIKIDEVPAVKTWWEGCTLANGIWFDAIAFLIPSKRPIARLRSRIAFPDPENILTMYSGNWLTSLMELRVHPDFFESEVQTQLLDEVVLYFAAHNHVSHVEAHCAEDSLLFQLLRRRRWEECDDGFLFLKN